jgi:hypothetical protein
MIAKYLAVKRSSQAPQLSVVTDPSLLIVDLMENSDGGWP